MSSDLVAALRALLGETVVAADEPTRTAHSGDKWFAQHEPEVVVFAQTTEHVSRRPADDEPFLQLRDDRKLKKGSEKGLSTN